MEINQAPLEAEFLTKVFRDSDVTLKGLRVDNPAVLEDIEKIQIYIENELTIWRQVRTVTNCWLVPDGKPPIDDIDSMAFNLLIDSSGNFLLKAAK